MKNTILNLLLLFFSLSFYAQEVSFDKKNFENNKEGFKIAKSHLNTAEKFMDSKPYPLYTSALNHYLEAQKFNPKSTLVNFNIGICYLNTLENYKSLEFFQNSYSLNANAYKEVIHYYLGRGYQLNGEWDKAIEHYSMYKKQHNVPDNDQEIALKEYYYKDVNKRIQECEAGKKLTQNTDDTIELKNMGDKINTKYPEYGLLLTADNSKIYFTSRRPATDAQLDKTLDEGHFEGIYTSNNTNEGWSTPQLVNFPTKLISHASPVSLSADGNKMILFVDDNGVGNLYESVRTGETWSNPMKIKGDVNSPYHESSAWYSADGSQLYFVSERPLIKNGDSKDRDIYVATWNSQSSEWANVQRLPETINSKYDEDGVFITPDGKTLYFSSKGHNSMGGYDVFKSVLGSDGTWSTPENLGAPINTPGDDVFYSTTANGKTAFLTSYRKESMGDKDIFYIGDDIEITSEEEEEEEEVIADVTQIIDVNFVILDEKTKKPIEATVEITDNETSERVLRTLTDGTSGNLLTALVTQKNYGVSVTADNYIMHSENINLTEEGKEYDDMELTIYLKKIEEGQVVSLNNIFYDFDRYTLRDESKTELNKLVELMNKNPKTKIKINSYADSRGANAYNINLSINRAKSVVNYLVSKGISRSRLQYEGFGSAKPIVTDAAIERMSTEAEKEAAHQKNRRTEFEILD